MGEDMKKKEESGYRVNVYLPLDLKEKYRKLNSTLKDEDNCISRLVQDLIVNECRIRGIK